MFQQLALPRKRMADNHAEIIVAWSPSENLAEPIALGDEDRGIAGRRGLISMGKSLLAAFFTDLITSNTEKPRP